MHELARIDRKKHHLSFRQSFVEVAGWSVAIAAIPAALLLFP